MKNLLTTIIMLITVCISYAAGETVDSITIEALVDGPSALHVRPNSIYWQNGENAKPGLWELSKEPTFVNDKAWTPIWRKRKETRGEDTSNFHTVSIGTTDLKIELISVSKNRGESGIEQRTPISTRKDKGEFVVVIPDTESGARWYKFVITKK